jgi:hypothetical protein
MLYNARRQKVRDWQPGEASNCPDCARSLFARRGEFIIWHWAHYADTSGSNRAAPCGHRETAWHLAWKQAHEDMGWLVEKTLGGYRADAHLAATRQVREFVHSLSPYYAAKHKSYGSLRLNAQWIIDGAAFESARRKPCRKGGGYKSLLVPRAYQLQQELRGRCLVHWDGALWREWKNNIWYENTGSPWTEMLAQYAAACKQMELPQRPAGEIRAEAQRGRERSRMPWEEAEYQVQDWAMVQAQEQAEEDQWQ